MHENAHPALVDVEVLALRPTQMTAGFAEIAYKRSQWAALGKKERRGVLKSHWFPAVLGPRASYYIVDHHHLALASHQEEVEHVSVMQLADYSYLELDVFWRVMETRSWVHPYDRSGKRCPVAAIPASVTGLRDDPHRSLAGFLRSAGGYAKDTSPFAEFLWADYLRSHIRRAQIEKSMDDAVREALGLARSPLARYLPGWAGTLPEGLPDATLRGTSAQAIPVR